MARRGSGEGTIYRHKHAGWTGTVQVGADENGRRIRRTVYGRTRGEVQRKLDELRALARTGSWADSGSLRVGEYLDAWLRDVAAPRVRPNSLAAYERLLQPVRGADVL